MNKNKMARDYAILNAWRKIQKYIRKNYANVFQKTTYIYVNETNTTRTELGIMPDGKSFVTELMKSTNKEKYCDHPTHDTYYRTGIRIDGITQPFYTQMVESVVLNWSEVKTRLEKRIQQEHEIYNFKILDTNSKNIEDHITALFANTDFSKVAIEALEKQIPKKPSIEADGEWDGKLVYDTWICPCCNKSYEIDYDDYEYCPNCGQHIDRSDLQ